MPEKQAQAKFGAFASRRSKSGGAGSRVAFGLVCEQGHHFLSGLASTTQCQFGSTVLFLTFLLIR